MSGYPPGGPGPQQPQGGQPYGGQPQGGPPYGGPQGGPPPQGPPPQGPPPQGPPPQHQPSANPWQGQPPQQGHPPQGQGSANPPQGPGPAYGAPGPFQQGQPPQGPPPGQGYGPGGTTYGGAIGGQTAYTQPPTAPPPPPKKKSKLGLILGIIGGVVVLAIIATVVLLNVVFVSRPGDTVEKYFEAIRAGNAAEALSYGASTPGNADLLTDEVLRKSNELAPITAVEVTGSSDERVSVTLTVDGRTEEVRYAVEKVDGDWKLSNAAFQPAFTAQAGGTGEAPLLVNGTAAEIDQLWIFPGTYEFTSGNANLAWGPESTLTLLGGSGPTTPQSLMLEITEDGTTAAKEAINTYMAACAQQKTLQPEGCPFQQKPPAGVTPDNSSVVWELPANPASRWIAGRANGTVLPGRMVYQLRLAYKYTYQGRPFTYDRAVVLTGTFDVDLGEDPPKVTFRQ